jgi:TRAP-type C4-dicarboxylate transport system permease large subunit
MGLITPPVAVNMYVVCSIMDCPVEDYIRECLPFIATVLLVEIFIVFFPEVVLFVPNWIFGKG